MNIYFDDDWFKKAMGVMSKVLVSLVTHSKYQDVCDDFLKLFEKNWSDCAFDFFISVIGENIEFEGKKTIYHGKNCTLPGAIYNIMYNSEYDYCISFLGDAFINGKIDNREIEELINCIIQKKIEYCCLIPRIPFRFKELIACDKLRYISSEDSYNISFVAFIASKKFISNEFNNEITDLDFEMKYLKNADGNYYKYTDKAIVRKNIFNIFPGIDAGEWNRHSFNKIRKANRNIVLTNRKKVSIFKTLTNDCIHILQVFVSKGQRMKVKKILGKVPGIDFVTKY